MPGRPPWPGRLLVVAAVAVVVARFVPPLLRPGLRDLDYCQHAWIYHRWADPAAFADDPFFAYFSSPHLLPAGYELVVGALCTVLTPGLATALVGLVLAMATVALVVAVGRRLGPAGAVVGLALVVATEAGLAVASPIGSVLDGGGVFRCTGMPIFLLGLLGLLDRRWWLLGVAMVLAVLGYPVLIPALGLAGALVGLDDWRRRGWRPDPAWLVLVPFALASAVLVLPFFAPVDEAWQPKVDWATAQERPEFGPGGRNRIGGATWQDLLFAGRRGLGASLADLVLFGLAGLALVVARPRREWWFLALAAVGLFVVTWFQPLVLYHPQRHLRFAAPVIVLGALAAALAWAHGRWPGFARLAPVASLAVAAVALVGLGLGVDRATRTHDERAGLYAWLATTPVDTLVAAHPHDADRIPLESGRSVLVSRELALAWHLGFYDRTVAPRLEALFDAWYATSWEPVQALHERFGVDLLVVDPRHYQLDAPLPYHPPFDTANRQRFTAGRGRFVLAQPPADRIVLHDGPRVVLDLSGSAQP